MNEKAASNILQILKTQLEPWIQPSVYRIDDTLIVFAWMQKCKRLMFFFGTNDEWSLRAWGSNTKTEMIEGDLSDKDRLESWKWFLS